MRLARAALACTLLAFPAHADVAAPAAPDAPTVAHGAPDDQIALMQKAVAATMLRENVQGAAIALVNEDGVVWLGGFGFSDRSRGTQTTQNTPFAAAAISPLIVGLLAARYAGMVEEPEKAGDKPRAALDEPLDAASLGLSNPFHAIHPITLSALLEQTAGLEDLAPVELLYSNEQTPLLPDVMHLRAHETRNAPGELFSPSRVGVTAAALQLERWTRRPFFTIADGEIFRPLGMSASTFRPDLAQQEALALGHRGGQSLPWRPVPHWPALGFISSAQDLASLLEMLTHDGVARSGPARGKPLLAPSGMSRIERGTTRGLAIAAAGLGTRVDVVEGRRRVGASGVFSGNAAELAFYPEEKLGYAVLLNAENRDALAEISSAAASVLLRPFARLSPRAAPPTSAATSSASLAGVWRKASPRLEAMRFFEELLGFAVVRGGPESFTFSASFGPAQTLTPTGNGTFATGAMGPATFQLVSRNGRDEFVTPDATYLRSSAFVAYGRLALVLFALLSLLSSLLFALLWLPSALFGALKNSPTLRLRALPALAALVLVDQAVLLGLSHAPLGSPNLTTYLLCGLSTLFPALSLAALLESLRALSVMHAANAAPRAVRAHALLCSLCAASLSLALALHGLCCLRTWAL